MKHLRLFETENEHTSEVDNLDLPCITYVEETSEIEIYPKVNCCVATYNISNTLKSSQILGYEFNSSQIQTMLIDGVEVEPTKQYKFTTTGEHTVKIILNKNFINANGMFSGCNGLTSLDLSKFDTSNVTSMGSMFSYCSHLTSLDLSNFDTSNVTSMGSMFSYCSHLTSLDLSSFDTSNVTSMSSMFSGCNGLTSLDLSSFGTSNVTNMSSMFSGCNGLTSLDLSNFGTSNVTNMSSMFVNCSSLTSLKMMGNINKLQSTGSMFSNITTTGTFYYNSAYNYSKITNVLPSTWTAVAV